MDILVVSLHYAKLVDKLSHVTMFWSFGIMVGICIVAAIILALTEGKHKIIFWCTLTVAFLSFIMPLYNAMQCASNNDVTTNIREYYEMNEIKHKYPHPKPYSKSLNKYNRLRNRYRNSNYDNYSTSLTPSKPHKWQYL